MNLFERLRRTAARSPALRHGHDHEHDLAEKDGDDDQALNSSHFNDRDYDPVDDEE